MTFREVVLQKSGEESLEMSLSLLLSLGWHSKQASNECGLARAVSFVYPLHLPFPQHIPHLVAWSRLPRCLEGEKAHPRLRQPFDEAMILFDQIVEVLHLPQFTVFGNVSLCF